MFNPVGEQAGPNAQARMMRVREEIGMSGRSPKRDQSVTNERPGPSLISTPVSGFGIRPPPMLLSVEFSGGVLPARSVGMKQATLADFHKRFIVWGKAEKLSNAYIARTLGCDSETVGNFLKKLRREEGIVYDVGVVQRIGTGKYGRAVRYFCRVCGETYMELRPAADHTFYHVFPDGGGLIIPQKMAREWEAAKYERPEKEGKGDGDEGEDEDDGDGDVAEGAGGEEEVEEDEEEEEGG